LKLQRQANVRLLGRKEKISGQEMVKKLFDANEN
jgi:hypothetical protein